MSEPVSKSASLPGAAELFRSTKPELAKPAAGAAEAEAPVATGRVRHDQKITVYFSSEELYALEDAVLQLKRHHGLNLDRGRVVRTAVALALRDLAASGDDAEIVAELRSQ
ncbi:MAG: hypothetical protein CSA64_02225 [Arachnia propionica]|nr:MAG: hypothetical protein CSA64_02225 [Arachnia propionica]